MSEKYYTAAAVPDISKDGKYVRLLLWDTDGKNLVPLIVSTPGMKQIVELLSNVVEVAEVTRSINAAENVRGFKPTPLLCRVEGVDIVYHPPTQATTLVIRGPEFVEIHLKFRPDMFRVLADLVQQFDGLQVQEDDTVN